MPHLNGSEVIYLYGSKIGGPGKGDLRNMAAQTQSANLYMRTYDTLIIAAVNAGECVEYSAIPHYNGNRYYPDYVLLNATSVKKNGQRGMLNEQDRKIWNYGAF